MVQITVTWTEVIPRETVIGLPGDATAEDRLNAAEAAALAATQPPGMLMVGSVRWDGDDKTFGGQL